MLSIIKYIIKSIPIAFTKNQKYDRDTKLLIKRHCKPDSNCIDVGCHKGEVFDIFIKYAPNGNHCGFEPIPDLFQKLKIKYQNQKVNIYDYALSDEEGQTNFNYVVSNPAYSGIIKRKYDKKDEKDENIIVKKTKLDTIINNKFKIDMMKIDVEGGEYQVLKGAVETIKYSKPLIIFEHGKGASEYYGTTPVSIYSFFKEIEYDIYTIANWINGGNQFSEQEFNDQFEKKLNYYFLAAPKSL